MLRPTTIRHLAVPLLLGLVLAACSARGVWTKEGSNQAQLRQDQKACVREADSFGFMSGSSSLTTGAASGQSGGSFMKGDLYRLCMTARGYGKVRAPAADE